MSIDSPCTKTGAEYIQFRMEQYWLRLGYKGLRTWIVKVRDPTASDRCVHMVRSNMVNGFPPREAEELPLEASPLEARELTSTP